MQNIPCFITNNFDQIGFFFGVAPTLTADPGTNPLLPEDRAAILDVTVGTPKVDHLAIRGLVTAKQFKRFILSTADLCSTFKLGWTKTLSGLFRSKVITFNLREQPSCLL